MRVLLPFCLLVSAFAAGCADDAPLDDTAEVSAPAKPMPPTVVTDTKDFGWAAAVGVPTTGADAQFMAINAMGFTVPEGATKLTVNATWTCAPSPCTLHFYLRDTAQQSAGPQLQQPAAGHSTGKGFAEIVLEPAAPGEWMVSVHADAAAVGVDGTFAYAIELPTEAEGSKAPSTESP